MLAIIFIVAVRLSSVSISNPLRPMTAAVLVEVLERLNRKEASRNLSMLRGMNTGHHSKTQKRDWNL